MATATFLDGSMRNPPVPEILHKRHLRSGDLALIIIQTYKCFQENSGALFYQKLIGINVHRCKMPMLNMRMVLGIPILV